MHTRKQCIAVENLFRIVRVISVNPDKRSDVRRHLQILQLKSDPAQRPPLDRELLVAMRNVLNAVLKPRK
jgi:hypothetical protein